MKRCPKCRSLSTVPRYSRFRKTDGAHVYVRRCCSCGVQYANAEQIRNRKTNTIWGCK